MANCGKQDKSSESTEDLSDTESVLEFTRKVTFLKGDARTDTVTAIEVAVASTQMEKNQGLMNVENLPRNKGMLFIFEREEPRSFWMANTPLPLDIIFVNEQKKIVRIHHSAKPYSEDNYKSGEPAQYVIETNGGFCINNDIHEGMFVNF